MPPVVYLARILPVFVLPTGLAILLILASLLFKRRALAVAALLVLWVAATPVVADKAMRAAEGWQTPIAVESLPQARAIVVLSGIVSKPPGTTGRTEWKEGVDRFEGGVDLLRAGKAPSIVFTDGRVPWEPTARPEGEVMAERAVALGVPRSAILLSGRGTNTAAEAQAVADLMRTVPAEPGAGRRIILVTSAFHMRRAQLLFTRAGFEVVPYPVDFRASDEPLSILDVLPMAHALWTTEIALREFYGYLYYLARGR